MVVPPTQRSAPPRPPVWIAVVAVLGFAAVLAGVGLFGGIGTVATSTTEPLVLEADEPIVTSGVVVDVPPPAGEIPGLIGRVVVVTGIGESGGYYRQIRLRVWDAESGMMTVSDLERSAWQFAVDPNGRYLAYRDGGGAVWVHDLSAPTGEAVIGDRVASFAWAPNGRRLAVIEGGLDGEVWELAAYLYEDGNLGPRIALAPVDRGVQVAGWNGLGVWTVVRADGARISEVVVYGDGGAIVAEYPGVWAWVGPHDRAVVDQDDEPSIVGDGLIGETTEGVAYGWPTDPDDLRLAVIGIDEGASDAGWVEVWDAATGTLLDKYDLAAPYGVSWDWSDRFVMMPAHRGVGRVYFYDTVDKSLDSLSFGDETVIFATVVPPSTTLNPTPPAVQN